MFAASLIGGCADCLWFFLQNFHWYLRLLICHKLLLLLMKMKFHCDLTLTDKVTIEYSTFN